MTMRETGKTFTEIGRVVGVHYATVSIWWDRYLVGGLDALAVQQRSPKVGSQRRLTARQEQAIQQKFGVALPVRTMGHYLKRWGFTVQKPIKRAYEQRPEAIAAWLKTEYPRMKRRALAEGAEIHWGDETSLSTSDARGRGFAPKGKTPVRPVLPQRKSVSFLLTISNAGTLRFMVLKKSIDVPTLIRFFTRLCKDAARKVFVNLVNLNVHKARAARLGGRARRRHCAVLSAVVRAGTQSRRVREWRSQTECRQASPGPHSGGLAPHRHRTPPLAPTPPRAGEAVLQASTRVVGGLISAKSWPK